MASTLPSPTRVNEAGGWRRERRLIAYGLIAVAASSWAYLFYQAWAMAHMDSVSMAMPSLGLWGASDLALVFTMWAIMMVAMMLPAAMPTVLLFAHVQRQRSRVVASWIFAAGYLAAWSAFSVGATLGQWALHSTTLLSPMMVASSPTLGGSLLIAAGLYQFTPFKNACLKHCQSPVGFLLNHWREGRSGAFIMGFSHGTYCVGCCWVLMAILFALGVMNLAWIAALAGFVALEKLAPALRISAGWFLIAWGVWILSTEAI